MKIKAEKLCGCRDPETGRKYGRRKCPELDKRGHGSWGYRFRVPKELVPLVGKTEISDGGYRTKKAAEDAGEEAVAKVRAGQQHIGGLTVGAYLDDWLMRKRRLRPTARRSYGGHIRLHLKPYLGELPLAGLRAHHIDGAYEQIRAANEGKARPTGPGTIRLAHATLRNALNDAVRQRMIPFSPADGVELPEYTRAEVEPWEAEEVGAFLDRAATDRLSAMWELVALHGLRRGEACGATWTGLDDARSMLTISQQITENGGERGVWAPKTRSGKRVVDLDATTLGSLLAHKLAQDDERDAIGPGWDNGVLPDEHGRPVQLSGLMFTRPDGQYLTPVWVSTRMQQIARQAGLLAAVRVAAPAETDTLDVGTRYADPLGTWTVYAEREPVCTVTVVSVSGVRGGRVRLHLADPLPVDVAAGAELGRGLLSRKRLHDLRHSSASIQLAEGVDLALVSKRLGHSTPAITGALYVHLLRPAGQAAAEKVAAAIPRSVRRGDHAGSSAVPGAGPGAV